MSGTSAAPAIIRLISLHRVDLSNEKLAQTQIADILRASGVAFERECRLSAADIPDFLTTSGLAIEVKLRQARKVATFKQLQRYAAHDRVRELLLITNLSMGLPPSIGGKPAYYASLGKAWL